MRSARVTQWLMLVAAVTLVASVQVRAQIAAPDPTLGVQDSTYAPRYRFTPVFTNKIDAGVSVVGMSNDFRTSLVTPWGSFFDFQVSGEEKNYRLSKQLDENKLLRLTDIHTFNPFLNGSLNFSDSRVYSRSVAVGGGFTEYIINDQLLTLSSTYKRRLADTFLGDIRTDAAGTGGAINSERTFKNDQGLQAGVNGGVAYSLGDRIVLQGRGAARGTWDESETVSTLYEGLGSEEDSAAAGFTFFATDSIRFDATHKRYNGERDFTDQTRGSLGAQTGGAEDVFQEHEGRMSRNTTLALSSRVMRRLMLILTASHDENELEYAVQNTRDSQRFADIVNGSVTYTTPWRSIATLQFETGEVLTDFGELSTAGLTEKKKRVALALNQPLSRTFTVSFNGSAQISQSFYIHYDENPRDRDQVDTNLNFRITSQPFKSVSAAITLGYTNTEFINIDATQSSNNRTRELWELRPQFTWYVNQRLIITQIYGLSFDYTDYHFQASENFLDRNLTLSNTFMYKPARAIDLAFEYALHLHDNGSYLPDEQTGTEVFNVASEDRRDRTRIKVDYRLTKRLSFFAENLYSRREEWTPGEFEERDTTTDGQIQVGSSGNYDWGAGKVLRFTVSKVKRFSPFGAEAEKDYWDARSEFAYPF